MARVFPYGWEDPTISTGGGTGCLGVEGVTA